MRLFLAAGVFTLAGAFSGAAVAEENPFGYHNLPELDGQTRMIVAHTVNMEWSSHTATLKRFVELVGIYTNNEIRGEIFPGGQLGGEREMAKQTR